MAERLEKWARAGFSFAIVEGAVASLEQDLRAARARVRRRTGKLAATIRIKRPSSSQAARTGKIRLGLSAGSRTVPYASVLQTGKVGYPPGPKTRPHIIGSRAPGARTGTLSFIVRGGQRVFTRRPVKHPGSRFQADGYVNLDEKRAQSSIDQSLQRSIDREIG
jgi:hypothetical protein